MSFKRIARRLRPVLEERWGTEFADRVLADAQREYPEVAARIPDIGGWRNVFTPVLVINGWMIALHLAMKRNGKSAEDTIGVSFAVSDRFFRSIPGAVLQLMGRSAFTSPVRRFFRRQAARSQARQYPADFVYQVEESADGEMSLVFSECAVNKMYDAQGLTDLKPYCNFFDVTYSRLMGMGVDAHETIGLGCERCALRFKHGRATEIPAQLQSIIHD